MLPIALAVVFGFIPAERAAALITIGTHTATGSTQDVKVVEGLAYIANTSSFIAVGISVVLRTFFEQPLAPPRRPAQ